MKKLILSVTLIFMAAGVFPCSASAKTGYVSDMLLLTFREGPGTSYTVLKTLKSDTEVNIVEEQEGFYKVELTTGETGWVDKKFIVFETPKSYTIRQLEQTIARIENKNQALTDEKQALINRLNASNNEHIVKIQNLEKQLETTLKESTELSAALKDSNQKYDTLIQQSKDIQGIIQENKTLKSENTTITAQLSQTTKKNKTLLKTGMIKWFLAGVATLLVGWILGQSVSFRKRSSSSLLD